jgi:hypothetical protein
MPITIESLGSYFDYEFKNTVSELHNFVEYEKDIKEFFDSLPEQITGYASGFFNYMSTSWFSISLNLPYNPKLMQGIRKWIANEKLGFKEKEDQDKSVISYYIKKPIGQKEGESFPPFEITMNIRFNPNHADSTCVLVPIETEAQPAKVITYDRVCPDSHPQLFKKSEDGKLVYIGDDLFPPKEV